MVDISRAFVSLLIRYPTPSLSRTYPTTDSTFLKVRFSYDLSPILLFPILI